MVFFLRGGLPPGVLVPFPDPVLPPDAVRVPEAVLEPDTGLLPDAVLVPEAAVLALPATPAPAAGLLPALPAEAVLLPWADALPEACRSWLPVPEALRGWYELPEAEELPPVYLPPPEGAGCRAAALEA